MAAGSKKKAKILKCVLCNGMVKGFPSEIR